MTCSKKWTTKSLSAGFLLDEIALVKVREKQVLGTKDMMWT